MFLSYFLNRGAEQSETWYLIIVPLRRGSRNLSTAQVSVGASRCPCIFPKARVRKHNYFHRTHAACAFRNWECQGGHCDPLAWLSEFVPFTDVNSHPCAWVCK